LVCLGVVVDELEVDVFEGVLVFGDCEDVGSVGDERAGDFWGYDAGVAHREHVAGGVVCAPAVDAGKGEDAVGIGERCGGLDDQRFREEAVAQFVWPAGRA
jgi:hypothetical protein